MGLTPIFGGRFPILRPPCFRGGEFDTICGDVGRQIGVVVMGGSGGLTPVHKCECISEGREAG